MIILDLEWNRGYDTRRLNELLQIGAVRVEGPEGPILDVFNVYIRPSVHKKFDLGAKKLPELQQSLHSDLDFPQALERFRTWCGEETEFAVWGNDDLQILTENCKYWSLEPIVPQVTYDLQTAFSHIAGAEGRQIALWRAVDYLRIPDIFCYHNALNDAVYTAMVSRCLTREDLTRVPPPLPPLPEFSPLPFPAQPRLRLGPVSAPENILDAPGARKTACPLCGAEAWVQQWVGPTGQQYYAVFSCADHGRFLRRLTVTRLPDGQWKGRASIPEITPQLIQSYQAARKKPAVYLCKGLKHKRRRRSRRKTA